LKTKRGCLWSQNAICRILTNELYIGKIINGKQEVVYFLTGQRIGKKEDEWFVNERPDLAIVDAKIFEKAQLVMSERRQAFKLNKERQSNKHLFSTLIKCKECGWSFRRTVRTYKNTYVRWVCSGHNGRGAESCPNAVTIDEGGLINTLEYYFTEILKSKKNIINHVVKQFNQIYKAKNENIEYEKELNSKLAKLKKERQKYMDMYVDDIISREELNSLTEELKAEMGQIEDELKLVSLNITKGEQLESIIQNTFTSIESIVDIREMTNAQLKQIIEKIAVDKDGNVDIYLRLLSDLGLGKTALISDNRT
jgi:hypothetical protein